MLVYSCEHSFRPSPANFLCKFFAQIFRAHSARFPGFWSLPEPGPIPPAPARLLAADAFFDDRRFDASPDRGVWRSTQFVRSGRGAVLLKHDGVLGSIGNQLGHHADRPRQLVFGEKCGLHFLLVGLWSEGLPFAEFEWDAQILELRLLGRLHHSLSGLDMF